MLLFLKRKHGGWLLTASALAVLIFWIRPVFLYVIFAHVFFIAASLFFRVFKASLASALVVAIALIWTFFFSPVQFFSDADLASKILRTAMFSDQETVNCLTDPELKVILSAFVKSIDEDPEIQRQAPNMRNDIDRYFVFALANIYRLYLPAHPIYTNPAVKPFLDSSGVLPNSLVYRMVNAAGACNFSRSVRFFILTTRMVLGLTPVLTSHAPRKFFQFPWVFYLSATLIAMAVVSLTLVKKFELAILILYSAAIYMGMVFIVALKQGGESRYTDIVEPAYVLATAIASAALVQELFGFLARRRISGLRLVPKTPS